MFKILSGGINLIYKILSIALVVGIIFIIFFGRKYVDYAWGMYYVHLGDVAYEKNDMQEAVNYYKQGLNLFPSHYEAWLNLGNIYVKYEDYFSATNAYENAIKQKSNYTMAKMNLGIITAEKLGNFDEAINQYRSIISDKKIYVVIPYIYDNKKSDEMNKGLAYYNMGHAYSQKAMYTLDEVLKEEYLGKAATAYEKASKILPAHYDIRYNLGLTYQILGNYRKAGYNYCMATEIAPMNYEAHYNLGVLLKHMNQIAYSLDELEKAAVLSSGKYTAPSKYIFDVLNDVSTLALNKDSKEKQSDNNSSIKDNTETEEEPYILINGKITPSEEGDLAILKNFGTCKSKK